MNAKHQILFCLPTIKNLASWQRTSIICTNTLAKSSLITEAAKTPAPEDQVHYKLQILNLLKVLVLDL